ncbi:acyltransferase family protein [Alistipes finegoldii]|uniref:acyltransferase family protein n=1 Tax=Alistipes finegoldii TaxID=214856 RepID=UPI00242D4C22|nr:acyltransferase [Alistipes finegoldii]
MLLQGWAMLWVVIGHSPLSVTAFASVFDVDCHECALFLKKIAYSFHMPLFIMISGYLFYITRIDKGASYRKTLTDKFKRLGIPYLFFTVFAFFLKVYVGGVERPVTLSLKSFVSAFVRPFEGPLQEMWFVAVVLLYFSLLEVYRRILKNNWLSLLCLCCAVGLFFIPVSDMSGVFAFNRAVHFFIFFFLGLLIAANNCFETAIKRSCCIAICLILYVALFGADGVEEDVVTLVMSLSGCLLCWGLAGKVDRNLSNTIFGSFRNYTYQIFLLGIFIQIGIKLIYNKLGMQGTYPYFYVLCILSGIYIPVLVSKVIQRIDNKYLNMLIGL